MGSFARAVRASIPLLVAAIGLVGFGEAHGQAPQQPPAPAAESSPSSTGAGTAEHRPEVIINGHELETRVTAFVRQVTDFQLNDPNRGLARWMDNVCPLVSGLPAEQGEYILGRVTDIAQAANVPLAGRHCHANLFILVTNHPQAFLRDMEKRHRTEMFGGAEPSVVEDFIANPRPVRTWYNTVLRTSDGLPMLAMSFPGVSQSKPIAVTGGIVNTPVRPNVSDAQTTNQWAEASHLTLNAVRAFNKVFVIIDPTRFKGVSLGQLADYAALVGLAQVKLDSPVGDAPSILTLFDRGQRASPGLTDWDRAFLKSIYATEQRSILQRSEIARQMVHTIGP
jgi:hypothetical protein